MKTVRKSRTSATTAALIMMSAHVDAYQEHQQLTSLGLIQPEPIVQMMSDEEIRTQEEAMWSAITPKVEPKPEVKVYKQGKIKVTLDGQPVDNLSAAMAIIDPIQFGKRNDFRDSEWTKINRTLKKYGTIAYRNHLIELV